MVELVDTQDLKSCDLKSRAGSIPALSTNGNPPISEKWLLKKSSHFFFFALKHSTHAIFFK